MHIIITASLLAFGVGVFVVYNIANDSKYRADAADMENVLEMRRAVVKYYEEQFTTELSQAKDLYHDGKVMNIYKITDKIRDEHRARIRKICGMDEAKIRRMYAKIFR